MHNPRRCLGLFFSIKSVWHLQTHGQVVDSAAMATGNEFSLEFIMANAVNLSRLRANKEMLTLFSESDGSHSLIQLHLSVKRENKDNEGNRIFFNSLIYVLKCKAIDFFCHFIGIYLNNYFNNTTHFRVLKVAAQHTVKVPHPAPTSRFPLFSILRMLTPCTEPKSSNLSRNKEETWWLMWWIPCEMEGNKTKPPFFKSLRFYYGPHNETLRNSMWVLKLHKGFRKEAVLCDLKYITGFIFREQVKVREP